MAIRRLYRVCEAIGNKLTNQRFDFQSYRLSTSKALAVLGLSDQPLAADYQNVLAKLLEFDARSVLKIDVAKENAPPRPKLVRRKPKVVRRRVTQSAPRKRKARGARVTGMSEKDFFKMCYQNDTQLLSQKRPRKR